MESIVKRECTDARERSPFDVFAHKTKHERGCANATCDDIFHSELVDLFCREVERDGSIQEAVLPLSETRTMEDNVECSKCGRDSDQAVFRLSHTMVGEAIVFQVNRFQYVVGPRGVEINKWHDEVHVPLIVVADTVDGRSSFGLVSVVCHHGSGIESGHCTCYRTGGGGLWWYCNDRRVSGIPIETMLSEIRGSVYLCVYRRF